MATAIVGKLIDTGHTIDPKEALEIIYCVPCKRSKVIQPIERFASEAIIIRSTRLSLCIQTASVHCLAFTWPVLVKGDHT